VELAEAARPVTLGARADLREIPLVTIDGADARDFDDAVWAEPDTEHPGGWHVLVAIADVAWYVRPADALDRSARDRGNSVYFPDRVVPMLPEALSNELCSLKPAVERACMAVHLWLDADGRVQRHRFVRGLMRSAARLTYEQVQAAVDGRADDTTRPLLEPVIRPLYGAYRAFDRARQRRGTLDLDLPERRILLDESGRIARIEPRARLDSHRLIEEFMISANVAAAEELAKLGCMGITPESIERGIRETCWPGRFQVLPARDGWPETVLDVAHNPAGAWALRSALSENYDNRRLIFVFGAMRDKAISEMTEILFPLADRVIATRPENPRSASPEEIQQAGRRTGARIEAIAEIGTALNRARVVAAPDTVIVVTGSIYLVGEAMRLLGVRT